MFTGIIEEIGKIAVLKIQGDTAFLEISAGMILDDLKVGDSVCVNGVCLTSTHIGSTGFQAQLSSETLERSSFKSMSPGSPVNLERALLPVSRLGGHFVQGHVDIVGAVQSIRLEGSFAIHAFAVPEDGRKWLVEKGSVAVNGVSLTVSRLQGDNFQVALIPHSLENTTLKYLRVGDAVNIEFDILAKYVDSLLKKQNSREETPRLTAEYLRDRGY
jgi:riboflavin synthase